MRVVCISTASKVAVAVGARRRKEEGRQGTRMSVLSRSIRHAKPQNACRTPYASPILPYDPILPRAALHQSHCRTSSHAAKTALIPLRNTTALVYRRHMQAEPGAAVETRDDRKWSCSSLMCLRVVCTEIRLSGLDELPPSCASLPSPPSDQSSPALNPCHAQSWHTPFQSRLILLYSCASRA